MINSIAFLMNTCIFFLQALLVVARSRISAVLWRTLSYLVQTIRRVQLRVTVISYSLLVSKKCHIVVRMGYRWLCYHHASVRCFYSFHKWVQYITKYYVWVCIILLKSWFDMYITDELKITFKKMPVCQFYKYIYSILIWYIISYPKIEKKKVLLFAIEVKLFNP